MIELATSSWTDVQEHVAAGGTLAILPFGALEQHGPHLPLSTDTLQADGLARRLAARFDAILMPPVPYGQTWDNAGFPGTVSLSAATTTAVCLDLVRAVTGFGITTTVIVNGDYGNRLPLHSAAQQLATESIDVIVLDYPGLIEAGDDVKETPWAAPGLCHADEIETSLVMALAPGTVRSDRMAASYPELPADFGMRPLRFDTLSPSGVFGDPRPATADKGQRLLMLLEQHSAAAVQRHLDALGGAVHPSASAPDLN
ncbi:creatininase family protein [Demequina capsici]|uniref:Creatininase family protein n=1 Tax=Demequina capsici TaxID=3075620 RepID=A0AA96FGN7_9MICO|nr:creatininase family protein [Demequina sp. PMTSA13]WNM28190.1 creatininase family protein [Demequina sp. PMTSA13]